MKKILVLIVSVLLVSVFTLTGCGGSSGLKNNPSTNAPVSTNGGITVEKDGYLYFTNGFVSLDSLTSGKNKFGNITYGGIYRTKLNSDYSLAYDENGFITNAELVVSNIVGYDNGSFYIVGDYIYYSTPTNEKDKTGGSLTNNTDFYKIKINGTDREKLYYSSTEKLAADSWSVYTEGKNNFLVIKDGSNIVSVNTNNKKSTVMAKEVSSSAILKSTKYYANMQSVDGYTNYVYYTRAVKSSETATAGNILARVKLNTSNEEIIYNNQFTYTMVAQKNNSIYYTKSGSTSAQTGLIFRSTISNGLVSNESQRTSTSYSSYEIIDVESEIISYDVLAINSGLTLLQLINGTEILNIASGNSLKIVKTSNDKLLYLNDGTLTLIDIFGQNDPIVLPTNDKSLKTTENSLIDFDGRTIYLFADYTSEAGSVNKYINRIDTNATELKTEFIGKFADGHTPERPDNTDKPEEEWEIWIK